MLSRVANSIYWLNRYIERAENIARFVDVNLNLLLDSPPGTQQQWEPLVVVTADLPLFKERYGKATQDNVVQFLAFDSEYPHSILSCLQAARENARSIREIISSEMWEQVNAFYWMVKEAAKGKSIAQLHDFFTEVKLASHLFAGLMDATLSQGESWHFGQMGRLLERADKTTRILDVKYFILLPTAEAVGTMLDDLQWMALLRSASAYEMYRKQGQHRITPTGVAEFLVLDRTFPRSILFCLLQVEKSIHAITGSGLGTWSNPAERALGRLRAELEFTTIDDIIDRGLHEFLDRLQQQANHIDDEIYQTFFAFQSVDSPLPPSRQDPAQSQSQLAQSS